jgi:hypothetical protein
MKRVFLKERFQLIERNKVHAAETITEERITALPDPLKKHLRVCGFINMPVPVNAVVYWRESWLKMSPDRAWVKLHTMQFNSVKPIGRVVYMKTLSMPVAARDLYRDGYGEMNVKLLNLSKVAFDNSKEVAQSALISTFCEFMLIPGYLLLRQRRIIYAVRNIRPLFYSRQEQLSKSEVFGCCRQLSIAGRHTDCRKSESYMAFTGGRFCVLQRND